MEYDKADPQSIARYAQRLLGKSLRQYLGESGQDVESQKEGKGRLGQIVPGRAALRSSLGRF